MNQQEATDFVIRELGKFHPRNDIIEKLCEQTGMNWNQAEELVLNIESQDRSTIARKQSPVLLVASIFVAFGSMGAIIWGLDLLYEALHGGPFPIWSCSRCLNPHVVGYSYGGNIESFLIGLGVIVVALLGIKGIFAWNRRDVMDQQEAAELVIQEAASFRPRKEIVEELVEDAGMRRDQADEFESQIESQSKTVISLKRSQIIITVCIIMIIMGFALCVWDIYKALRGEAISFMGSRPTQMDFIMSTTVPFLVGAGLIAVGLRGAREAVVSIRKH